MWLKHFLPGAVQSLLCVRRREDGIFQQSWPGGEVGGKETARLFSGYLLGFVEELLFYL